MNRDPALGPLSAGRLALAEVVAVNDPEGLHRVELKLLSRSGFDSQSATVWARVAVPFAGNDFGAFLLPGVGEQVLVGFVQDDPRYPVVLGALWHGAAQAPEQLGGGGDAVDRWTLVGRKGTRIAIEEPADGQPQVEIRTPGGVSCTLEDSGGGELKCSAAGATVTLSSSGVRIDAPGQVEIQGAMISISAGMVSVDSAMVQCSGMVTCQVLQATTVVSSTYTPGAGNVW